MYVLQIKYDAVYTKMLQVEETFRHVSYYAFFLLRQIPYAAWTYATIRRQAVPRTPCFHPYPSSIVLLCTSLTVIPKTKLYISLIIRDKTFIEYRKGCSMMSPQNRDDKNR